MLLLFHPNPVLHPTTSPTLAETEASHSSVYFLPPWSTPAEFLHSEQTPSFSSDHSLNTPNESYMSAHRLYSEYSKYHFQMLMYLPSLQLQTAFR